MGSASAYKADNFHLVRIHQGNRGKLGFGDNLAIALYRYLVGGISLLLQEMPNRDISFGSATCLPLTFICVSSPL